MATATAERTQKKTATNVKIRPLDDRLLIQAAEAEDKTKSGIYLPESAKEKPMLGTVIAAGPGKMNDEGVRTPVSVKAGDTVVYGKYAGTEVELEGAKYMLVRESELLGVVER